jgi:capsular polysaccharide biosynthesis protein
MRIGGFQMSWLRRRWWVIVGSMVVVTMIGFVLQPGTSSNYTAETVLIVRSGATTNTPGSANEASRLAVTYSQLIGQDTQVLDRVSRALNVPRSDVEKHVTVANDPNTSILRARYSSSSANTAVDGARALADALAGPNPASPNFNGVGLSRLPDKATSSDSTGKTLPLGAFLGLCLGIVLVIALERSGGRIENVEDAESEVGAPGASLERLSSEALVALTARWAELSKSTPARIAVISAAPGYRSVTNDVAEVLHSTLQSLDSEDRMTAGVAQPIVFVPAGAPGTYEAGEAAVHSGAVTVMVVPQGAAIRDVRRSLTFLRDFGTTPQWTLFASERVVQRASAARTRDDATLDVREPAQQLSK